MTESSFSYINSIVSNISLDFEIPICRIYHMYVRTFCSLACFAFPNINCRYLELMEYHTPHHFHRYTREQNWFD
jgi:hypothetical protein